MLLMFLIAAVLVVRNLPPALRPFFSPPESRHYDRAVIPMVTVVLGLVVLVMAWKNLHPPLISWPR